MSAAPLPHPAAAARQAITDALLASGFRPDDRGVWRPLPEANTGFVGLDSAPAGWRPLEPHHGARARRRWVHTASATEVYAFAGAGARQGPSTVIVAATVGGRIVLRPVFDAMLPARPRVTSKACGPDVRAAALHALAVGGQVAFDATVLALLGL